MNKLLCLFFVIPIVIFLFFYKKNQSQIKLVPILVFILGGSLGLIVSHFIPELKYNEIEATIFFFLPAQEIVALSLVYGYVIIENNCNIMTKFIVTILLILLLVYVLFNMSIIILYFSIFLIYISILILSKKVKI